MIFGGKGWVRVNVGIRLWLLRTNKTLRQNVAGVIEYNSMWKSHSHLHNALSNESAKWYFRDASYDGYYYYCYFFFNFGL